MEKQIIWKSEDGTGEEKLSMQQSKDKIRVTSTVQGGDADLATKWNATYSLVCDAAWRTFSFTADEHNTNRHLEIRSDGNGRWQDGNNKELANIAGCIDIDFRATPFSNTLPIRRLHPGIGESVAIDVVYINAPDLALSRVQQIYTRLSKNTWKFEQPEASFEAVIAVDDDGLVVDYPGLFHRKA
jgi:hypothetical protein